MQPERKLAIVLGSYSSERIDKWIAAGYKEHLGFQYKNEIERAGLVALLTEKYGALPGLDLRIEIHTEWSDPTLDASCNNMTYAERQAYLKNARQPFGYVHISMRKFPLE